MNKENHSVGPSYNITGTLCLSCGELLDGAAELDGESRPSPGSISLCIYCGNLAAFDDNMRLRPLTKDEIIALAGDPTVLAAQRARELIGLVKK